jgi:hypothetical protein
LRGENNTGVFKGGKQSAHVRHFQMCRGKGKKENRALAAGKLGSERAVFWGQSSEGVIGQMAPSGERDWPHCRGGKAAWDTGHGPRWGN